MWIVKTLICLVCDVENKVWMFDEFISCPGPALLNEIHQYKEYLPDQLTFKQWISTDWENMITEVLQSNGIFELLTEKLVV